MTNEPAARDAPAMAYTGSASVVSLVGATVTNIQRHRAVALIGDQPLLK